MYELRQLYVGAQVQKHEGRRAFLRFQYSCGSWHKMSMNYEVRKRSRFSNTLYYYPGMKLLRKNVDIQGRKNEDSKIDVSVSVELFC